MGGIGTTGDPNAGIRGGAPPWTVNRVDNIISMLLISVLRWDLKSHIHKCFQSWDPT